MKLWLKRINKNITRTKSSVCDLKYNCEHLLKEKFQLEEFRPQQWKVISDVLEKKDVMAILPTGGGKSLCYQFPAVYFKQLVIVVSPLIALMQDQVEALNKKSIPAGCIYSGQTVEEKRKIFKEILKGGTYILYLSPERIQKSGFMEWIKNQDVGLIAVDEAHCISQWGHDFRPEYVQIKTIKEKCPQIPFLVMTASATPDVILDMKKQINLVKFKKHVFGFYRKNLYFQVISCHNIENKYLALLSALKKHKNGRIIIYCGTRQQTEELAKFLNNLKIGEFVLFYHAGLSTKTRKAIQDDYAKSKARILVSTNAFGMGIDHPNVRLVIHYNIPGNIDALYQEMGRAGRDGQDSTCLLLFDRKDIKIQKFFVARSSASHKIKSKKYEQLNSIISYADASDCRHKEILRYYGDKMRMKSCGHCDNCVPDCVRKIEITENVSRLFVHDETNHKLIEQIDAWRHEKAKELNLAPYEILNLSALALLIKYKNEIRKREELMTLLGPLKFKMFGSEIDTIFKNHS